MTRTGTVYALRNTATNRIFYIGATIDFKRRLFDHKPNNRCKYGNKKAVKHYIREHDVKYTVEILEELIGERTELMKTLRMKQQRFILKIKYPIINYRNPLKFIRITKNKYPWLSNKTLLKTIVKK